MEIWNVCEHMYIWFDTIFICMFVVYVHICACAFGAQADLQNSEKDLDVQLYHSPS